jgi:hypothetical protein
MKKPLSVICVATLMLSFGVSFVRAQNDSTASELTKQASLRETAPEVEAQDDPFASLESHVLGFLKQKKDQGISDYLLPRLRYIGAQTFFCDGACKNEYSHPSKLVDGLRYFDIVGGMDIYVEENYKNVNVQDLRVKSGKVSVKPGESFGEVTSSPLKYTFFMWGGSTEVQPQELTAAHNEMEWSQKIIERDGEKILVGLVADIEFDPSDCRIMHVTLKERVRRDLGIIENDFPALISWGDDFRESTLKTFVFVLQQGGPFAEGLRPIGLADLGLLVEYKENKGIILDQFKKIEDE